MLCDRRKKQIDDILLDFADNLAILMTGSLEKRFLLNIVELEERAKHVMYSLEKYTENNLLPVNIKKTKAVLMHNFQNQNIKNKKLKQFLHLNISVVTITQKLGWGSYISMINLKQ